MKNVVPPLGEGFIMNRVQGDYFENLLYQIFVSVDERTTISQLANTLQIDIESVKTAVAVYILLGFAKKKNCPNIIDPADFSVDTSAQWHSTWVQYAKLLNSSSSPSSSRKISETNISPSPSSSSPENKNPLLTESEQLSQSANLLEKSSLAIKFYQGNFLPLLPFHLFSHFLSYLYYGRDHGMK